MKKAEKIILADALRKLAENVVTIANVLEGKVTAEENVPATEVTDQNTEQNTEQEVKQQISESEQKPEKTYTFEDARGILAGIARNGYSAEIKAILKKHSVNKLSEISDPAVLAQVVAEAESIGSESIG